MIKYMLWNYCECLLSLSLWVCWVCVCVQWSILVNSYTRGKCNKNFPVLIYSINSKISWHNNLTHCLKCELTGPVAYCANCLIKLASGVSSKSTWHLAYIRNEWELVITWSSPINNARNQNILIAEKYYFTIAWNAFN